MKRNIGEKILLAHDIVNYNFASPETLDGRRGMYAMNVLRETLHEIDSVLKLDTRYGEIKKQWDENYGCAIANGDIDYLFSIIESLRIRNFTSLFPYKGHE